MEKTGRPKGGKNRRWSKEEKLRIVRRYFDETIGESLLAQHENVSGGLLHSWIAKYMDDGEAGLESKRRGNPYSALHSSKNLTELERLHLTVAKQEAEIARLKKGYWVKGGGVSKVFVISTSANTKSSKK